MNDKKIHIEVVYALPKEQFLLKLEVPLQTTIAQAVKLSGLQERFPEIDLEKGKFGLFGKFKCIFSERFQI